MKIPTALVLVTALFCVAESGDIDNQLSGPPLVDCRDNSVIMTFSTEKPFNGRIYVKGLVDHEKCSRNFATNIDQRNFSMQIDQGDCNMQRQRIVDEGLMFSLVVVVSFHGTFETKNDRAFRCMCLFRNTKHVTNFLNVSTLGTTELLDDTNMPTCMYTIHSQSPEGPLTRNAQLGELIYHVWQCDGNDYGIMVHSCLVHDGRGQQFELLDDSGCAVDPVIQSDLKYETALNKAFVETWAYKFSDTAALEYQCMIELCRKSRGECQGLTPPLCGRGKRSVEMVDDQTRDGRVDNWIDMTANLNVLGSVKEELDESEILEGPMNRSDDLTDSQAGFLGSRTCLSRSTFSVFMEISFVLFLMTVITGSFVCTNSRYYKALQ